MTKLKKQRTLMLMVIVALHLVAVVCYHLNVESIWRTPFGLAYSLLRSSIYILLFLAWGVSVRYRIIARATRKYLLWVVAMMVFWMLIRTIKYNIYVVSIQRYLWYLYYIPIVSIPVLSLFVSLTIGKRENFTLSKWKWIPVLIGVCLVVSVITNDFHQFVFYFPPGKVFSDADYRHGSGYFIILLWVSVCIFLSLLLLVIKCRVATSRRILWVPLIPVAVAILYCILYIRDAWLIKTFVGDMTVFLCCFTVTLYECCILCNLIGSNMHYEELFAASDLPVYITDEEYHLFAASRGATGVADPVMRRLTPENYIIQNNICTFTSDIRGGHVFWREDVTKIADTISQLEDASEALQEHHAVAQEELRTNLEKNRLREANRIYQAMQLETNGQIQRMQELVDALENTNDPGEERRIAAELAMRGAYFKRRNNLLFITETKKRIRSQELTYCLHESLSALELKGIRTSLVMKMENDIALPDILMLYDKFQEMVECAFEVMRFIVVFVEELKNTYELQISMSIAADRTITSVPEVEMEEEDGEYILMYHLTKKEGDQI